jgi:diacylglycerol kinase (ATP)
VQNGYRYLPRMGTFVLQRMRSFKHAIDGGRHVVAREPNARIHVAVALAVIAVGAWLGLSPRDWAAVVLAMGGVFVTEAMNTAIERAVDLARPENHPLAKVSKDVAAAAVLVAAVAAVVVGVLILGPPLWCAVVSPRSTVFATPPADGIRARPLRCSL